jgi:hypothetical protein
LGGLVIFISSGSRQTMIGVRQRSMIADRCEGQRLHVRLAGTGRSGANAESVAHSYSPIEQTSKGSGESDMFRAGTATPRTGGGRRSKVQYFHSNYLPVPATELIPDTGPWSCLHQ